MNSECDKLSWCMVTVDFDPIALCWVIAVSRKMHARLAFETENGKWRKVNWRTSLAIADNSTPPIILAIMNINSEKIILFLPKFTCLTCCCHRCLVYIPKGRLTAATRFARSVESRSMVKSFLGQSHRLHFSKSNRVKVRSNTAATINGGKEIANIH